MITKRLIEEVLQREEYRGSLRFMECCVGLVAEYIEDVGEMGEGGRLGLVKTIAGIMEWRGHGRGSSIVKESRGVAMGVMNLALRCAMRSEEPERYREVIERVAKGVEEDIEVKETGKLYSRMLNLKDCYAMESEINMTGNI